MRYLKVYWLHTSKEEAASEPWVLLYEVGAQNLACRAIEVFGDRLMNKLTDLYSEAIEITEIPTISEINEGIWGEHLIAYEIGVEEFEALWQAQRYSGDLYVSME